MALYDANSSRSTYTIDIEENTTIPVFVDNAGNVTNSFIKTDRNGTIAIQMFSDDISASVDWKLEISLDGTNWDTATDANGTDITGTLAVDTPFVNIYRLQRYVDVRVNLTVTTETGNITYVIKEDNDFS